MSAEPHPQSPDPDRIRLSPLAPAEAGRQAADWLSWALLAAALLFGLLRFVRLGTWSLWLDEVFTWGDAHSGLGGNYNDLGYHLIRWTVSLVGDGPTETALRLLPAVAGYLAVPLTWWAFRPVAGHRRAALAALLVAVSAWQLQWSQNARFYTFAQAATLLGAGIGIRGLATSRVLPIAAGIAVIGAGITFQLQAAVVAGAFGAASFLISPFGAGAPRRAARTAFVIFAIGGLVALPKVWGAWKTYVFAKPASDPISGVAHFALSTGSFVTPLLGALAIAGVLVIAADRDRSGWFVAAVPTLALIVLAGMATMAVTTAQYAFALFPWIALLAAWPVGSTLFSRSRLHVVAWSVVAALPLLASSGLYIAMQHGQRARWKEAVALVEARRAPTDVIVGVPATVVEFYLTGGFETDVRKNDSVVHLDKHQPRAYEPWARSGRRMWLVVRTDYINALRSEDRAQFRAFLREECRLVERFPVFVEARDLSVEVWTGPE